MTMATDRLAHMVRILSESPISFRAWRQYFKHQAETLAEEDPKEFGSLPQMLDAEIARLRLRHTPEPAPGTSESSSSAAPRGGRNGSAITSSQSLS